MTIQDRLSEIEDDWSSDDGPGNEDVTKLVKALLAAINTIQRQTHPHIESFCKDRAKKALTEIERILNAEGE